MEGVAQEEHPCYWLCQRVLREMGFVLFCMTETVNARLTKCYYLGYFIVKQNATRLNTNLGTYSILQKLKKIL